MIAVAAMLIPSPSPAKPAPDGRAIYRQLCVKCHGRSGEGVKGRYDDALHGDWSIEKLTRVIERTMPEDDPGKCKGPDAEAVARYIYDAFYSREAREKRQPARIELLRLTNPQYQNTVADLLLPFWGERKPEAGEPGLKATYYASKDFRNDRKAEERVDRALSFDFMRSGIKGQPAGTNEVAAQWRGSVIAEETGDYEFILETPNGARLWVNQTDDPVIDAWVASGKAEPRKATVRLLGGRSYPLRLDFFRHKEKEASLTLRWKPPRGAEQVIPARNLSTAGSTSVYVVNTPFPADDNSVGYERGVSVSKEWDEAATQAAIQAAHHVVHHLDRYSGSKPGESNRVGKVRDFASRLVEAAFRRPLSAEQRNAFVTAQFAAAANEDEAVKRVVMLALKSPRFLYLGLERSQSDDHEVATRLSYGLWDSLPDRELTRLAGEGRLRTHEQVAAQARRMLADPRAHAKVQTFLQHWLHMNRVEDFSKDGALYPGFTPEIVSDLRTSLKLFLDDVVWSPDSDYRKLLQADYLYLNPRLAAFYGVTNTAGADFERISFDPALRSGVITHPYLLSAFSYQKSSSPIHRGVFLTRNIVGRALKSPPIAVAFKDAEFAPNLSMREKVAELTRPQACQTCHSVINPLGFTLENYDAVGRFRTRDGGKAIDAITDYITDDGTSVRLTGARDVARFAVSSGHAQRSFVEQLFHSVVKQPVMAYGSDAMNRLHASFERSGFNIQQLLVEMATLSALPQASTAQPARKTS